ncbi:a311064f-6696-45c8-853d-d5c5fb1a7b93 [Thermothielavioides terrestris]|uniref:A311064f-6696-45c8-853d-d5c5fb1a7b93 n=1 Tax=Thermothielavioides terrestris TaxID=2587410 RepID=A0A446B849_9PEZI|nr:a311064f-6696-45c8-853d-d5c5fb1a7b93 [Thermothielavioides terrestris]
MLFPRTPPAPRLRIACLGRPARTLATLRRIGRVGRWGVTTAWAPTRSGGHGPLGIRSPLQVRGKKTRTVVKLDELPQGVVAPPPELLRPPEEDEPAYPTVVLQARRNMQKFDNCVLLTRVGGFYEMYFDQADEYGPLLNLKAGFPFFQLDRFLKILVQDLNRHVAIAEEFPNDPSEKVKSGGLMHNRRVTRIVTPGTLIDENFMDPYASNYVMAIHQPEPAAASDDASGLGDRDQRPLGTPESASIAEAPVGLAWLDLSTGSFFTQPTTLASLGSVLTRVSPREIVLDKALESGRDHVLLSVLQEERYLVTYSPPGELRQLSDWAPLLESEIPAHTVDKFTDSEVQAGNLLLHYVRDRLQGLSMKLQPPLRHESMHIMHIDKNSMRSLEIKQTIRDGAFKGSLLHAIRRTVTKSGARLLNEWLSAPSTSLEVINFRQDLVARFIDDEELRDAIIVLLRRSHDSQRLVQKFALNRGDPDDLLRLANTIKATEDIVNLLTASITAARSGSTPAKDNDCLSTMVGRISLDQPLELAQHIRDAIDEEGLVQQHQIEDSEAGEMMALAQEIVKTEGTEEDSSLLPKGAASKAATSTKKKNPASIRDHYGEDSEVWIMKPGASALLTRLHEQLAALRREKEQLTETLRTRLNAASLTLRWTPTLGHICHVKGKDARQPPTAHNNNNSSGGADQPQQQQPAAAAAIRTLSSSRTTRSFHQPEWTALGESLDKLRFQIRAEEQRVFAGLRARVVRGLVKLRRNARVLDELDIATSFARLAAEQGLVRPTLTAAPQTVIVGGRHPTVEGGLAEQGRTFQRNDCFLGSAVPALAGEGGGPLGGPGTFGGGGQAQAQAQAQTHGRVWLITGPNMAGKSTFLRQNALITILAQIGCYVPADYASLGIVDAIFSRVGSADNLYQDQSTFMVEMLETAAILRQATPRSFVIMDEVGRGTTPEDGTAVAFAALHHLVRVNRCRALFATHFHDIADLVAQHGLRVQDGGPDGAVDMYCTDVEEDENGGFIYVHKLRKGVNRQSHALKVARLAGLPEQAIRVAQQVLQHSGVDISSHRGVEQAKAPASAAVVA